MGENREENQSPDEEENRRESGLPGGGKGRRDEISGTSGIYPVSGDKLPEGNDELVRPAGQMGQRGRGLEGYYDHGESGLETAPMSDPETENQTGSKRHLVIQQAARIVTGR